MCEPIVVSGMKEWNHSPRGRINGVRFVRLRDVATLASKSKVTLDAFATTAFRLDMFDGVQLCRAKFRALAIFAIT